MKNFLHHLLFPRESNNHRAKLLHHDSLFFLISLFLFSISVITAVHNRYPAVLGISTNIATQDLLTITNEKRKENHVGSLAMDDKLTAAATAKANFMFEKNFWAHIAPDGTTPWYFIKNAGYEYLYAGENLARGFTSAPDVVNAWMASPSHRENMLSSNYKDVGFAVKSGSLTGSETILVVEMFGSKYVTATVPQASAIALMAPSITPSSPEVLSQPSPLPSETTAVAAVSNQPLIDSQSITKQIALGFLFFFIGVLIVDAIIVERKKIVRVVAHNLDHIIFLTLMALIAFLIGRGFTL
ncbi:MAG TPA: CAP domain-containing protein [Methylomirabilota bacterium]|nr:CAP domain-containing protein [Methylomirabilota bacterium]